MKGVKGVNFNDRELAGKVRTMALNEVMKVLKTGKGQLYSAVLVRLAGTILPRLNELSGEGGEPIVIQISGTIAKKNGITPGTGHNSG